MSKFKEGDRVIATMAFHGEVKAHLISRDSTSTWNIQAENPTDGSNGRYTVHETRLRPATSDAKLANKIVCKIESIRKHREAMLAELKELRELLAQDGVEAFELREVDGYRAVVKHTLNFELLNLLNNWESAEAYRTECERVAKDNETKE